MREANVAFAGILQLARAVPCTRSKVKMINEVMKTIRRPCAIRLTRNSRINIEKGYPCIRQGGQAGLSSLHPT